MASAARTERDAEKCPEAKRLATHPGVGSLIALVFVLIVGEAECFPRGKQHQHRLIAAPLHMCNSAASAEGSGVSSGL